ncbi:MAG: hypothetical protein JWP27_1228, partial [Flaviaesturariibacter sp.]|nr:hypothetical protein [Flaviaesturariibacter sp.]
YEQFGMTLRVQGREMSFSSENPRETDVLSKMLAAMTGQYFTVKMTRLGKLLVVENLDQLFETVVEQMAGVTPEQKQQSKEQMLRSYGEKAFKGSFETITNIYSNSAVEKGDTWSIDTKLESVAAATLKTTFKFEGMVDGYHQIVGTGRFETLDKDAYSDISGMPTKYHLSGTATSAFKLDAATGWIIEGTVAQSLSGNAEIKDNPDLRGGLTIPMSIESKLEYRSH